MSLGRACVHDLPEKLDQAAKNGIEGIEIFYEDLEYIAENLEGGLTPRNEIQAAGIIKVLCDERNINIICLQPFMHYEGLVDQREHKRRISKMKLWLRLAKALGTNLIAVPSTFLPESECTGDLDVIVTDMIEIANLGLQETPVINFSYEGLAWGTHIDTWEQTWEVVQRVDRPNFGLCLDTFNIIGRLYADPASPSGLMPNGEVEIQASIARLSQTVDIKKVFYIQVVDAEKLQKPLNESHELFVPGQSPRMTWSRNCRLFYGEEDRGAYLPCRELTRAIVCGLGFDGWISMELFNRSMSNADLGTPAAHASRASVAWDKIVEDLQLDVEGSRQKRTHMYQPRL
ncbi:hypothetical protein MMC10_000994 [Thelotrema lepadinum]|nr:hypothetical protein [Thelotrema lepadinum]